MTPADVESAASKAQAEAAEVWKAAKFGVSLARSSLHCAEKAEQAALQNLMKANKELMDATLQVTSQQEAPT